MIQNWQCAFEPWVGKTFAMFTFLIEAQLFTRYVVAQLDERLATGKWVISVGVVRQRLSVRFVRINELTNL